MYIFMLGIPHHLSTSAAHTFTGLVSERDFVTINVRKAASMSNRFSEKLHLKLLNFYHKEMNTDSKVKKK